MSLKMSTLRVSSLFLSAYVCDKNTSYKIYPLKRLNSGQYSMATSGSMLPSGPIRWLVILVIYFFICVLAFIHPAQMKLCTRQSFSPTWPSPESRATTTLFSTSLSVIILDPT